MVAAVEQKIVLGAKWFTGVAGSVVFLVEIFWAAVNFGWKWPALAPPDPPLHPSLCSTPLDIS